MMLRHWRVLLLISIIILVTAGGVLYAWLVVDLPSFHDLHGRAIAPTTKIYDRYGRLLYEIIDPHVGKHTPLPLDQIPVHLRQATVATEDANFYANPGVDLRAILRALIINLRGGEVISGGSTITQQLARNLLLSPEERVQRTLTRKLRESILAWRLARTVTKDEILALYLNESYYGNLAYGVEAAAQAYFGKSASELDLAECALLAGLPQSPATYNPLENPQAARERQAVVLELMVKNGYISEEEARLAREEQLHFAAVPFPIRAPHFVMYVWGLLERRFGPQELYRGGLEVYTTLDVDMQEAAQSIVRRRLATLADRPRRDLPDPNVHNAALVALDPNSGEILAMLGSPDYFDPEIDGAVNCALAPRQPGSSIKPLTYAAAFAKGYTPATMILDVRTAFLTKEGEPYVPLNYDLAFHGPVLAREALASSYNLPAVKVLDYVGLDKMTALARSMGITTFDDSERFGLALTLGGGEVRLLELTAAYAAFAKGGSKVEPVAILRIEDTQGHILYQGKPGQGERVLDERIAYLITDILSDDLARMPAFGEGSVLKLSRPAAVKTGTTTDWRDNWTIGYTPELVVGVWAGNADNSPMRDVSGVAGAAPLWHDFMEEVLEARPVKEFAEPEGLTRMEVCTLSGQLPNPYCPHRRTELFVAGTEPKETCQMHRLLALDAATGQLASSDTPSEQIVERVYTVLPAEATEWGRERGLDIGDWRLEVGNRDQETPDPKPETRNPLILTSPHQGSVYRLDPGLPWEAQRIEVAARARDGVSVARVTIYVGEEPLASFVAPPYRVMWPLAPGEHTITAAGYDTAGNRLESQPVHITVIN
jgi:1A family penicillin-binding protein